MTELDTFEHLKYRIEVNEWGDKFYYNSDDQLHREEGPAVIQADGTQRWCINGKLHREDGPAVIWASGRQAWCINGKRHREDGPADILADGRQWWYINGKHVWNTC